MSSKADQDRHLDAAVRASDARRAKRQQDALEAHEKVLRHRERSMCVDALSPTENLGNPRYEDPDFGGCWW